LGLMCLLVPLYTLALSDSSLILSLVVGTFPLTEILLSLLSGVLSDYLGRRMVIVTGFVCFVGACWVCSAADSHYWLLAGQILLGLGDASIFIAARALLIDSSPSGKQTALQGLGSAAALTGTILGPFVGGCLSEVVGFAATFFVGGVLAVRGKKTWGMAGHLFLILVTVRQYDWPLRGTRPATTPMRPWLQC
jgi:MFS family permease